MKIFRMNSANQANQQLKKNILPFFSKFAFTLLMAITLFACCEEEPVFPCGSERPIESICPPGHPCQNAPTPVGSCNPDTYVTVTNVNCGVGVWGSYWLQLDNGDLLQPWLSNDTDPIQPGERYAISYGPATRDNLYDNVITCRALTPAATPIRINCMEPVLKP